MLARFTPGKGHEEFLWAAKELSKEYKNLRLLIVGEPSRGESEYANKIKQLAEEYGLKNIIFTGYRGDTPEVLAALDIFAFPSHSEAFGIALVEAMAMKKPAVCSNAEGVLDIAVNNETAYLFENKNESDLKLKLKELIDSEETRINFGENARKLVIDQFAMTETASTYLELYRNVLLPTPQAELVH